MSPFKSRDFEDRPLLVIWEMTQACDLRCVHCRASAQPQRHPLELSSAEAFNLIDQVAAMRVPLFVLTGGDPLKRPDLYAVVQYAHRRLENNGTHPHFVAGHLLLIFPHDPLGYCDGIRNGRLQRGRRPENYSRRNEDDRKSVAHIDTSETWNHS